MLNNIDTALRDRILSLSISGGYNYDWQSVNNEDFNLVEFFPLVNIYQLDEASINSASYPDMNSLRNQLIVELHCYNRLPQESSNSVFDIDRELNYMLHDIKKMIGNYPTLNGAVEYVSYIRSTRQSSGKQDDLLLPKKLVVTIAISYSQDSMNPEQSGSC